MENVVLEENISVSEFLEVIESVGFKSYSEKQAKKGIR